MVYLFIGQDSLSKDIKLKSLKQEFLPKNIEQFNLDILYAHELNLKDLQERLLCLPVKAKRRLVVIKNAGKLKEDIKTFLVNYVKKPLPTILLVLDIDRYNPKDEFIKRIAGFARISRFKESTPLNTFTLSRAITLKKTSYALKVLNQLLKNGEKPERILGGLRYALEEDTTAALELRKRMKILLNCDIDIKTGRLKVPFALEKCVVGLCSFG